MWENILKQPKANLPHPMVLGDVTQMKRKLKPIPEKPPKKTCMEKIKEYGDFLREREGILGRLETQHDDPDERLFREESEEPDEEGKHPLAKYERVYSRVRDIPEEVACKALEYLKRGNAEDVQHRTFKHGEESWLIIWRVDIVFEEYPEEVFGENFAVGSVLLYIGRSENTRKIDENLSVKLKL